MVIFDLLFECIELFKEYGYMFQKVNELFWVDFWLQVMLGQGFLFKNWYLVVKMMSDEQLVGVLKKGQMEISQCVVQFFDYEVFVVQYCG